MTASQQIARALHARGVRLAFGMPGGVVLPLLEAFREVGIDFVLVRDEASAGFAADAVWTLTGAPGVVVATLGPGVTNLVSGVAGAWLDRSELVAIIGQVAASQMAIYTHQTLDQLRLFEPITKYAVTLTPEEAWREVPLALRRLRLGRPGPVLLNIPGDVYEAEQPGVFEESFEHPVVPAASALAAAAEQLRQARRPVIAAGFGALHAAQELRALSAHLGVPVLTTYKAKGVLPEEAGLSAGSMGLSPKVDALQQALIDKADLLLCVGLDIVELRPNWLPGWREDLPVLVLDDDVPHDLLHPIQTAVVGDLSHTLRELTRALPSTERWSESEIAAHRGRLAALFEESAFGPASAIRAVQSGCPDNVIATLDVGAHRITAAHVWGCGEPGRLLQSNGLSSMGYGLPAAIGAALCSDDDPVVCITGDMGLQMALGELGIIAERGLDVVVVVLRDDSLSLIELKQERMELPNYGVRFEGPDIAALAKAFGGVGVSVRTVADTRRAVSEGIQRGGLTLVEAVVDAQPYRAQM